MAESARSRHPAGIIEQLYREHADTLRKVAFRILRDLDDAEDAVQEVFRKLRPDRVTAIAPDERVAYLMRAVKNEALRIAACVPPRMPLLEETLPTSVQLPPKRSHRFRYRWLRRAIAHALRTLPRGQRRAVWLTKLRGCTRREAAAQLGIRPTALEKRLTPAFHNLHRALRQRGIRGMDDVSSFLDGGGKDVRGLLG
ncbi:MAG: sigma-70 family RNA polymerase sigma factor [Gemmatimonadota bacterium]